MKAQTKWLRRLMVICMVAGLLCAVSLVTGCKEEPAPTPTPTPTPANGTITVRIVDAGAEDGEDFLFAVFAAGADPDVDDPLGVGGDTIAAGTAELVAFDPDPPNADVTFTGGSKYDVYGWVENVAADEEPTTGEPYDSQLAVEVDGNMLVVLDYADFVAFP